jgi:hypothetical protein
MSTLLHGTVYMFLLHNLLNVLVQIAKKKWDYKKKKEICFGFSRPSTRELLH